VDGDIFNVVDDDPITSKQFLSAYKRAAGSFFSIRVPYRIAYGLSWMWEKYSQRSEGQLPPVFNRRRCSAEWKGNRYSNRKLRERLGWKPRIPMTKAMEAFLGQFVRNGDVKRRDEARGSAGSTEKSDSAITFPVQMLASDGQHRSA
jgi:nucleoside-diphosphate-sugar epimerase